MPAHKPGSVPPKKKGKQPQDRRPDNDQIKRAFDDGYKQGVVEGKRSVKTMVLTFLQKEYMSKEVERGSQFGKDILELTARLSKLLK